MGEEGAIGEVHGDLDFVPRWVVRFFLISSGRSSVGAFLSFHNHLPVCADTSDMPAC